MNTIATHPDADSYVTLTEADDYLLVKTKFSQWENLADDSKERLLIQATRQIDMLPFSSVPMYRMPMGYRMEQNLKFPLFTTYNNYLTSQSFTNNSITTNTFKNNNGTPTGMWDNGALVIREGTGRGKTYQVTSFNADTGVIQIEGTFEAIGEDSQFHIIKEVPDEVRRATVEQAFFNLTNTPNPYVERGVTSVRIDDVSETYARPMGSTLNGISYSIEALGYLEPFISMTGRIQT